MRYDFTRAEVKERFGKLALALAAKPLRQENGPPRTCGSEEFMLMHETDEGVCGFKHHFTRNYVFLFTRPVVVAGMMHESGTLYVPMQREEPFMHGYFDAEPEVSHG